MSLSRARERERRVKDWSCHEHIPFPHHTQSTSCQSNPKELLVAHYYESKVYNPTKLVKLFKSLEKTLDTMLTMSYSVHLRYIRTCKFRFFFILMIYLLVNSGKGSLEKNWKIYVIFLSDVLDQNMQAIYFVTLPFFHSFNRETTDGGVWREHLLQAFELQLRCWNLHPKYFGK